MNLTIERKKQGLLLCNSAEQVEMVYKGSIRLRTLFCDLIRNGIVIKECFALFLQQKPFSKDIDLKNEMVLLGTYDTLRQLVEYCKEHNIVSLFELLNTLYTHHQQITLDEIKELVKDLAVPSVDPLNPNIRWERLECEKYKLMKAVIATLTRAPFIGSNDVLSSEHKKNIPDLQCSFKETDKGHLSHEIKKSAHQRAIKPYGFVK